jgi:threonine/homoserine/homoserine lactone efflux protein
MDRLRSIHGDSLLLVPRHRGGELAFDVNVGVICYVEDDLDDLASSELELRFVVTRHSIAAVVSNAEALTAERACPGSERRRRSSAGGDAQEVVDVVQLAALEEERVPAEPGALGEDHAVRVPCELELGSEGQSATWVDWLKVALGVLLVLVALKQWRSRPREGDDVAAPKWMGAVSAFTPGKSLGGGALLASVNPKNLLLAVAAATIAQTWIAGGEQAIAYALFALIGTLGVGAPVMLYFTLGKRAQPVLDGLKGWMSRNNGAIMAVLCLVIGAKARRGRDQWILELILFSVGCGPTWTMTDPKGGGMVAHREAELSSPDPDLSPDVPDPRDYVVAALRTAVGLGVLVFDALVRAIDDGSKPLPLDEVPAEDEPPPDRLLPLLLGAGLGVGLAATRMGARAGTAVGRNLVPWISFAASPGVVRHAVRSAGERAVRFDERWRDEREMDEELGAAFLGSFVPDVVRGVLDELDLTELTLQRIDLDRIVDAVDLDRIVARIDPEAIVRRLDLTALAQGVIDRLDLAAIATRVIDEIDLPRIVRESTGTMADETVVGIRAKGMTADRAVSRFVDRMLGRQGDRFQLDSDA